MRSRLAIGSLTTIVVAVLAGCVLRDGSGWTGASVMTVHWERYKFVDPICRKIGAIKPNDSDPPEFAAGCRKIRGTDCYVYTDEARGDLVGSLVQSCFEQIQPQLMKSS